MLQLSMVVSRMNKLRYEQLGHRFEEEDISPVQHVLQGFWQATEQSMNAAVSIVGALLEEEVTSSSMGPRRHVRRAEGKWRGSTVGGYWADGDDITFRKNFRLSRASFDLLHYMLLDSAIAADLEDERSIQVREEYEGEGACSSHMHMRNATCYCRSCVDPPTTSYKIATCLYAMGQGGPLKNTADSASLGVSTVRCWLEQFCAAILTKVKPLYMPCTPFSEEDLRRIRWNFAARRGINNVALACDGSHIPFFPRSTEHNYEYKNYKGWQSILAVAFVDSYYRFFDLDVGAPGKAGDNTVLRGNWFMKVVAEDPDRWLGEDGVILGDCGASDGDRFFLNPFFAPTQPEHAWFNFCHSSTRFYVEETFGRWKNRWRFLVNPIGVQHRLQTLMIYVSAILHNYCTVHARDRLQASDHNPSPDWQKFYDAYGLQRCKACEEHGSSPMQCVHEAAARNKMVNMGANARRKPSQMRVDLCKELWEHLLGDDYGWATPASTDEVQLARAEGVSREALRRLTITQMQDRVAHRLTARDHLV